MKKIQLILIFCLLSLSVQRSRASQAQSGDSLRYQLVLFEPDRGPEIAIPVGTKIVCKQKDRMAITGTITGYADDAIVLKEEIVPMDGLVRIRYFRRGHRWQGFVGRIFKASAGILSVLGIGSLISVYSQNLRTLGMFRFVRPIVFLLALPLFLLGILLANAGNYDLKRKYEWEMKEVKKKSDN